MQQLGKIMVQKGTPWEFLGTYDGTKSRKIEHYLKKILTKLGVDCKSSSLLKQSVGLYRSSIQNITKVCTEVTMFLQQHRLVNKGKILLFTYS